jgi:microcin C transport system permease protein
MMVPTLIGITLVCFVVINLAPGGPIEQKIQQIRFGGGMAGEGGSSQGIPQEVIDALKKQYGFDKPLHIRYLLWLKNIVTLDFGDSFSSEEPVLNVIASKFPVSLQFGIVSFILTYLVCIPLGVMKAIKDGTQFDAFSSLVLYIMWAIPPLMLGVLLIVFFAGGSFFDWFPIMGTTSDDYEFLTLWGKILDRIHHFILPLICYIIGNFTVLTFLMKNSLLDEIRSDYVRTARAKGLSEKVVIYKHALRNSLIPIATGFGSFVGVFFAGSIIIEQIFSLDGMGLLGYRAALERDYNVLMALIFIQSVLMLFGRLISDFLYVAVDPRIDFS